MKKLSESGAPTFATPGITRPFVDLIGCAAAAPGGEQTKEIGNVQRDKDRNVDQIKVHRGGRGCRGRGPARRVPAPAGGCYGMHHNCVS